MLVLLVNKVKAGNLSRLRQSIMGERQHGGADDEEEEEEEEREEAEGKDGDADGEEGEEKEEGEGEEGKPLKKKGSHKDKGSDKEKASVERDSTPVPFIVCGPYQVGVCVCGGLQAGSAKIQYFFSFSFFHSTFSTTLLQENIDAAFHVFYFCLCTSYRGPTITLPLILTHPLPIDPLS